MAEANVNKVITFSVGHDHEKMLISNYPIYRANWEFINDSLALVGYSVEAMAWPWARAVHLTQMGKADGLFLAANLAGRDEWANLSKPLGYGIFGGFFHVERPSDKKIFASVRLGLHDKVLSNYKSTELIEVATAHEGFKLLFNKRIDRFLMSESYAKYLIDTELTAYKAAIAFDTSLIERRSVHIAFSKHHNKSIEALNIVNSAIAIGIENGLYKEAMIRNNVPQRMRLKSN